MGGSVIGALAHAVGATSSQQHPSPKLQGRAWAKPAVQTQICPNKLQVLRSIFPWLDNTLDASTSTQAVHTNWSDVPIARRTTHCGSLQKQYHVARAFLGRDSSTSDLARDFRNNNITAQKRLRGSSVAQWLLAARLPFLSWHHVHNASIATGKIAARNMFGRARH